jgi:RNA polymerase sigma factor (sigma-70 family)
MNIEDYYGLVIYLAKKIHTTLARPDIDLKDLIQEGFTGLLDARSRYDPKHKQGAAFATFATHCIKGTIRNFLRKQKFTLLSIEDVGHIDNAMKSSPSREVLSLLPSTPEENVRSQRLAEDTQECLQTVLNDVERAIIIPRILEGIEQTTLKVLERQLNIPLSTVARREKIAKQKLKQCLENKGWGIQDG